MFVCASEKSVQQKAYVQSTTRVLSKIATEKF